MKSIVIRLAEKKDAVDIAAIYAPYVVNTPITFETEVPSVAEIESRIAAISLKYPYLVCEIDGVVAGYAYASTFRTRAAYQWDAETSVYIDAKFHRRKIATALYVGLLGLIKAQGFCNAYAVITVPNEQSVGFHEAFDFVSSGVIHNTGYKMDQWHDVLTMEKALTDFKSAPSPLKTAQELDKELVADILQKAAAIVRV